MTIEKPKTLLREHIDRCIECYGVDLTDLDKPTVDRDSYEQMRIDLMMAVGMLMVFESAEPEPK